MMMIIIIIIIIMFVIKLNLMKYKTPLFLLARTYLGDFNRPVFELLFVIIL